MGIEFDPNAEPVIPEATGERREMIDKLLGQAGILLGEGWCGFRNCYGQGEVGLDLTISGDKASHDIRIVLCADHHLIVEMAADGAPDEASLAGFFMMHLDERYGLPQIRDQLVSSPPELN